MTWTITNNELTITFTPSIGKPIEAVKGSIVLVRKGNRVEVNYETGTVGDDTGSIMLFYDEVTSPVVTGVSDLITQIEAMIVPVYEPGGSSVESVTGDLVDNTDPANPVINNPVPAVPAQKTITDANSPYTVLDSDRTIFADATGADVIIILPSVAASSGRELTIKKIDAGGNRVKVTPDGSDEIEGNAGVLDLTSRNECCKIQANGIFTWWFTVIPIP